MYKKEFWYNKLKMVAKILTEVRSTESGLVGITESGECVNLSVPEPKFIAYTHSSTGMGRVADDARKASFERSFQTEVKREDDGTFFQRGEFLDSSCEDGRAYNVGMAYNVYSKRE